MNVLSDNRIMGEEHTNNTKQAAWIAIGSMFSFGFGIISSMILSRYFDKSDYGTYKQVIYVYNTLLTVFTLGLPRAYSYFLPRVTIDCARSLINKITKLFYLLGLIFTVFLFWGSNLIAELLHNPELSYALKLFSIVPVLMLPTMGLEGILATYKRTKFMALYTVLTRIVMLVCVALPVLFWNGSYIHAIIGFDIASLFSFLLAQYLQNIPVRNAGNATTNVTYREIWEFSLPLFLASICGIIIQSADQFFVSRYFGTSVFADFSNGNMEMPFVGMIIGATSTVLSPIFSRMHHEKVNPQTEIFPLWKSVFEKSAKLIYPMVAYCIVFADIIMVVLYGDKYEASGSYFRIRLITNFFTLIAFAPLLINIGKVRFYTSVQMYSAIILIPLQYIVAKYLGSAIGVSCVSMLCTIGRIFVMLYVIAKVFEVSFMKLFPIKLIALILVPSFLILIAERWILVDMMEMNRLIILVVSLLVYMMIYLIYSYIVKLDYMSILKQLRRS